MNSPHHRPLRLGTRGSPLALAQAGWIARQLRERCGQPSVVVTVATPGDESTAPIERLGTTGVFTTTLRAALLRGAVDFVVHSAKDLPTAPVPGLQVAAFPAREDPRDALIWPGGTSLDALPPGARIGTGSPRRAALLRAAGRQLQIVPMRGNVDTRLRKLADGEVDALVLAMAGLSRLGLLDKVATPLDPLLLMPAPAQGVLAVECRTDDPVTAVQLRTLDHAPTRAAAITERSFLATLDVGCGAPVGALTELVAEAGAEPAVRLSGLIAAPDGSSVVRAQASGAVADGAALGRRLAHLLLEYGGAALLDRTWHGVTEPRSHRRLAVRLVGADHREVLVDEDVVRPVDADVVDLVLAVAQLHDTVHDAARVGGQRGFRRLVRGRSADDRARPLLVVRRDLPGLLGRRRGAA
jgi:hydroxymethylbilane synthase